MEQILSSLEECPSHEELNASCSKSVFAVCTLSGTKRGGYKAYTHCLVETFDEARDIIENFGGAIEERHSVMAFIERHSVGPSFCSGLEHYWYKWCEGYNTSEHSPYGSFVPVKVPKLFMDICNVAF